jgi:signal transduction histidine kinase/CheY-like chemotaxis protein
MPASPTLQALMAGDQPSGTGETVTLEGSKGFTAFVLIPESRWSVALSIPHETVLAGASRAFMLYGGGAVLSVLVALLAASLMAKRVAQPILALQAAAEQLGAGGRPTPPQSTIPEIASLGSSIVAAGDLLRDEQRVLEILNQTGGKLASTLELKDLLQAVTDAGTEMSGAQFGAFFYNTTDENGDAYLLYTLSGAPVEAFATFGKPRATPLFAPTFRGGPAIRCDDVLTDPRYGQWGPHKGMPEGHLPVRSYLGVSVVSRTGEVIGGLFFGHATPGVFTARAERLVTGLAAQAAVAIDNARLYDRSRQSAAERAQLLDSERAARAQSERESAIKDEFLATLSHELRTPLSAIIGWAQVLRRPECGNAERIKGVETIERNARAQAQLIDDLLDMSRVIAGKLRLDVQSTMPHAFTESAIETVRPAATAKNIRLETMIDPGAGPVTGDPARLQQVIWNLLSNAIKFTPPGGKVQVVVRRFASQVEICVADTGIGIPEEFLPRVFERFRQADSSTTRRHGGLGLGLAISKQLVELHGGTIEASSAGENRGATFAVRLPLAVIHRVRADSLPHPRAMPMLSAGFQPIDLAGTRVLVVDDDRDARELANRLLEECGATVDLAGSALEALRSMKDRRPDVLVTDIGMPDMDGYELLRQVRLNEGDVKIPAIALTAFARSEDRTRALRAGFLVHVAKPVEPTELVAAVAAVAGRAPGSSEDA